MMSSNCCVDAVERARGRGGAYAVNRRLGGAFMGEILNIVHLLD